MFKLDNSTGGTYADRQPPASLGLLGACKEHENPGLFFGDDTPPGRTHLRSSEKTRRARLICAGCPVKADCLAYSLDAAEPYGVWAGLDRHDRAFVLACRPSHLGSQVTGRPMREYSVPCDTKGCPYRVPLAKALRWLTSDGARLCSSCRLVVKTKLTLVS